MAFKGKTTAGYKSTTGKQLGNAKTAGKVNKNPSGNRGLKNSSTNIVTKATQTGSNPRNSRTQKLNANRVQRAGGNTQGKLQQKQNPAANITANTRRSQNKLNQAPFQGYSHLTNSRNVPAGRGNIRNAGTVQRNDVARIRQVGSQGMPKAAISGASGKGFRSFIGGK